MQILEKLGIKIFAHILSVGDITDEGRISPQATLNDFPVIDSVSGEKMKEYISLNKEKGDSVGGIVECARFADEFVYLGMDFLDKYEEPAVHRKLENLIKSGEK